MLVSRSAHVLCPNSGDLHPCLDRGRGHAIDLNKHSVQRQAVERTIYALVKMAGCNPSATDGSPLKLGRHTVIEHLRHCHQSLKAAFYASALLCCWSNLKQQSKSTIR